jgi:hypothetical protein
MPTIYANTSDNDANSGIQSSFSAARDFNGTAFLGNASDTSEAFGAGVFKFSGRGSDTFRVNRSYFYFDVSSITGELSSCNLRLFLFGSTGTNSIRVIKSTAFGGDGSAALANTDFDNVDFSADYSGDHTVTNSSYNTIALNSDALTAIKTNDFFIVAVVNSTYDFADSSSGLAGSNYISVTFADNSGTAKDPALDYELATGYTHDISGLAAASISKVNTVATANIGKINSLD